MEVQFLLPGVAMGPAGLDIQTGVTRDGKKKSEDYPEAARHCVSFYWNTSARGSVSGIR
jgi:hypothetical protein